MKDQLAVVFCCDDEYVKYLSVAIISILENCKNQDSFTIIVLEDDIQTINKQRIEAIVRKYPQQSLSFLNIRDESKNIFGQTVLKTNANWSRAIYYRMMIPLLLRDYKRVLYLDTDVIVNSDLKELINVNIGGYKIAAVLDTASSMFDFFPERKRKLTAAGLVDCRKYFNSGVLLFNNENINPDEYKAKLSTVLNKELVFYDQDALNIIFQDDVYFLKSKYNSQISCMDWESELEKMDNDPKFKLEFLKGVQDPVVIHYIGPWKPWQYPDRYGAFYFWQYSKKSSYYEEIIYNNLRKGGFVTQYEASIIKNSKKIFLMYLWFTVLSALSKGVVKDKIKVKRDYYRRMLKDLIKYNI